ncbi:hypothetical protein ANN_12168 [Periplaneta americana]|uniref:Uncharacterized protein n=1 Tax=Periplaneta americana TaxID=6978 RepID=A0ABQ8T722_PERAM|nr:hypothetical protein ANN_12168 [Periplaneta americana]
MAGLCEGGNEPPCSLKASKFLEGRQQKRQGSDVVLEAEFNSRGIQCHHTSQRLRSGCFRMCVHCRVLCRKFLLDNPDFSLEPQICSKRNTEDDCETWILTLREEQRLRVFENKVLRKIFGGKRDEVTGEWRKLHNTELHALYSSPDIIRNIKSRRLRWAGHVAHMGESKNAYRVLVGRPEGKRP